MDAPKGEEEDGKKRVPIFIPSHEQVQHHFRPQSPPILFRPSSSAPHTSQPLHLPLRNPSPAQPNSFTEAFSFVKGNQFYSPPPPPPPQPSPDGLKNAGTGAGTSGSQPIEPQLGNIGQVRNAILVSRRQQGNPVLKHIRNVRWLFADIVPDYLLGQNSCALFLSLRYHLLHPDYIYYRIRELLKNFRLRVVLCYVDVEDVIKPLHEVTKTALLHDCTLICARSPEECARYLETLKIYKNKPADNIQERMDHDYLSRLTSALTTIRHVNRTDVVTLGSTFGTLASVMGASMEDLARCPGIGEKKTLLHLLTMPLTQAQLRRKRTRKGKFVSSKRCKVPSPMQPRVTRSNNFNLKNPCDSGTPIDVPRETPSTVLDHQMDDQLGDIQLPQKRRSSNWTIEDMANAISAHEDGLPIRECARQFGMSWTSISAWIDGRTKKKQKGPASTLSSEEETALVEWIFKMQDAGQGVSLQILKLKVAEMCQTRDTTFTNGIPGKSWWDCFRKRHPELSFRTTETLNRSRAVSLRPEIVKGFHDNLERMYALHAYPPERIWNADETGVQAGKDKGMRVIARKGSKVVYGVCNDNREWLTILCCVNAMGHALPGYYIFKGKKVMYNYLVECEEGAVMSMQNKAWITSQLFEAWLEFFRAAVPTPPTPNSRHLLIVDGHSSHTRLDVVQNAMEWGIDIVTLPAHTSHKLQPLDVAVFKSFKSAFQKERNVWQTRNFSTRATKSELAGVASRALAIACKEENIRSGFRASGIWPLNHNAINFDHLPCTNIDVRNVDGGGVDEIQGTAFDDCSQVPETQIELEQNEGEVAAMLTSLHETSLEPMEHLPFTNENSTEPPDVVNLLRVPREIETIVRVPGEVLVDYSNSLILTSPQYIETMAAKNAKRLEVERDRERKRHERAMNRAKNQCMQDERRRQREEASEARVAKRRWEAQQKEFERQLRAVLWEGQSVSNDIVLPTLHVSTVAQKDARVNRLTAMRAKRNQTASTC